MCTLLKTRNRRFRAEKGGKAGRVKGEAGWSHTMEAGQLEHAVPFGDLGQVLALCAEGALTG